MSFYGSYLWNLRKKIGTDVVLMPGSSILVLNSSNRVLLTKRTDNKSWCMPGGSAELNGSFLQTAINELREEVGIKVNPKKLVPYACISRPEIHMLIYPNGDQTHCFAMWFVLLNWEGNIKLGDEVTEAKFFEINKIPDNTLLPSKTAVKLYKKFIKTGLFQVS